MRDNGFRASIQGSFQNQLIVRVAQLRAVTEVNLYGSYAVCQIPQQTGEAFLGKLMRGHLLRSIEDIAVLEKERLGCECLKCGQ